MALKQEDPKERDGICEEKAKTAINRTANGCCHFRTNNHLIPIDATAGMSSIPSGNTAKNGVATAVPPTMNF